MIQAGLNHLPRAIENLHRNPQATVAELFEQALASPLALSLAVKQSEQSARLHNPTAKTLHSYRSDLHLFTSLTGEVFPDQVTPKDIDHFVNIQVERGFKPTTINRHMGTVVSLYRFLGLTCPVCARRHRLREPQRLACGVILLQARMKEIQCEQYFIWCQFYV